MVQEYSARESVQFGKLKFERRAKMEITEQFETSRYVLCQFRRQRSVGKLYSSFQESV